MVEYRSVAGTFLISCWLCFISAQFAAGQNLEDVTDVFIGGVGLKDGWHEGSIKFVEPDGKKNDGDVLPTGCRKIGGLFRMLQPE